MQEDLQLLIGNLAKTLSSNGMLMCTAESCTGGLIGASCTSLSGSSEWFAGGYITYTNNMKISCLDVKASSIENFGAVSEQVVQEMAKGAIIKSSAHASVAVSGVAGPTGGSPEKPVGTVCIAAAILPNIKDPISKIIIKSETMHFAGDREEIRRLTVLSSLSMLLGLMNNKS